MPIPDSTSELISNVGDESTTLAPAMDERAMQNQKAPTLAEPHVVEFVELPSQIQWPHCCVTCGAKDHKLVTLRLGMREFLGRKGKFEYWRPRSATVAVPQCNRCRALQRRLTAYSKWIPGWIGVAIGAPLVAVNNWWMTSQNVIGYVLLMAAWAFVCYMLFAQIAYKVFSIKDQRLRHLPSPCADLFGHFVGFSGILGCFVSLEGQGRVRVYLTVDQYAPAFKEANPGAIGPLRPGARARHAATASASKRAMGGPFWRRLALVLLVVSLLTVLFSGALLIARSVDGNPDGSLPSRFVCVVLIALGVLGSAVALALPTDFRSEFFRLRGGRRRRRNR